MNKETIEKLKEFLTLKPEDFYMNIVITFTDSHRVKTLIKLDNGKYKNFYFNELVRITELMKYFEENYYFYRKGIIDDVYLNYNTVELYYLVEKDKDHSLNDDNRLNHVRFNETYVSLLFMNKLGAFWNISVAYKERILRYIINVFKNKDKKFYYEMFSSKLIHTPNLDFFDPKIIFCTGTIVYNQEDVKGNFKEFLFNDMYKNLSEDEAKEVINLVKFDNI